MLLRSVLIRSVSLLVLRSVVLAVLWSVLVVSLGTVLLTLLRPVLLTIVRSVVLALLWSVLVMSLRSILLTLRPIILTLMLRSMILLELRRRIIRLLSILPTLLSRHRVISTTKVPSSRRSNTNTLISDIVRHRDLDLGQVLLHLLLHHVLYKHPTLTLKLAMTTVHYTKDTLAQRLLHLSYKTADLVDELRLDVISKTPVCRAPSVAVQLRVEGVTTEDLL
ncbi:hypothetical protein SNK04_007813 [Fusarium graminearum]